MTILNAIVKVCLAVLEVVKRIAWLLILVGLTFLFWIMGV